MNNLIINFSGKMNSQESNKGGDRLLMKYLGLSTQIIISLGLAVFAGLKVDKWMRFSTPLLVWVLPLLVLGVMIWQIIKDTSKK